MNYHDGTEIKLGDIVTVPVPSGAARGRVIMLGADYSYAAGIKQSLLEWVQKDKVLKEGSIIIEWIDENPFAHNDPKYAPVGNEMFNPVDECTVFVQRGL